MLSISSRVWGATSDPDNRTKSVSLKQLVDEHEVPLVAGQRTVRALAKHLYADQFRVGESVRAYEIFCFTELTANPRRPRVRLVSFSKNAPGNLVVQLLDAELRLRSSGSTLRWSKTNEQSNAPTAWVSVVELPPAGGGARAVRVVDSDGTQVAGADCAGLEPDATLESVTVVCGSCYDVREDAVGAVAGFDGEVGKGFGRVAVDRELPSCTVLMGDQIYYDQPPSDFLFRETTYWVEERFRDHYRRSLSGLRRLFESTTSILLTDDHEYWNDFPRKPSPPFVWPSLNNGDYRRTIGRAGRRYAELVQGTDDFRSATLLNGTPLGALDLRVRRRSDSTEFVSPDALNRFVNWLRRQNQPVVIALSQPLFQKAVSQRVSGFFDTDHNVAYYEQYGDLVRSLIRFPHDIVLLAGDPHFSRVAYIETEPYDSVGRIVEVVSSPLAGLRTSPGYWDAGEADPIPSHFPIDADGNGAGDLVKVPIEYVYGSPYTTEYYDVPEGAPAIEPIGDGTFTVNDLDGTLDLNPESADRASSSDPFRQGWTRVEVRRTVDNMMSIRIGWHGRKRSLEVDCVLLSGRQRGEIHRAWSTVLS